LSYDYQREFELFNQQAQKMLNQSISLTEPVNGHKIDKQKSYDKYFLQNFSGQVPQMMMTEISYKQERVVAATTIAIYLWIPIDMLYYFISWIARILNLLFFFSHHKLFTDIGKQLTQN